MSYIYEITYIGGSKLTVNTPSNINIDFTASNLTLHNINKDGDTMYINMKNILNIKKHTTT